MLSKDPKNRPSLKAILEFSSSPSAEEEKSPVKTVSTEKSFKETNEFQETYAHNHGMEMMIKQYQERTEELKTYNTEEMN